MYKENGAQPVNSKNFAFLPFILSAKNRQSHDNKNPAQLNFETNINIKPKMVKNGHFWPNVLDECKHFPAQKPIFKTLFNFQPQKTLKNPQKCTLNGGGYIT